MERIVFTEHNGIQILIADFSNLQAGDELTAAMEKAKEMIRGQPPASVRVLADITNGHFNQAVVSAMKEFTSGNTPFIKADAVVGVEGLLQVGLTAISRVTGRNFKTFKDRASAMDWLAKQ